MKLLFLLLCLPFFAAAQTVHLEDGRIAYEDKVNVENAGKDELYQRARAALQQLVGADTSTRGSEGSLSAAGTMKLTSTHSLRNRLQYTLFLKVKDDSYRYRIDSVYLVKAERGAKPVVLSSEELVKGMDITGPTASQTEKQLNEIDMRFQRLIALLATAMRKPAATQP